MNRSTYRLLLAGALAAGPLVVGDARAAAYYIGEIGARSLARGGAVIVNPGDPSSVWLNPAAMSLSTGVQLQLDASVIFLDQTFVRDCGAGPALCGPKAVARTYPGGTYEVTDDRAAPTPDPNDTDVVEPKAGNLGRFGTPSDFGDGHVIRNVAGPQVSPQLFATLNLDSFGLDGFAIGGGIFAPMAGDYAFDPNEATRYSLVDIDRIELYYSIGAAYRFRNWIAVGATLQGVTAGARQTVKMSADQYGNEDPRYDILVEADVLQHFIPSGNVGVWSSPLPGLEIGASAQGPRFVNASGPLTLREFGEGVQEFIDAELAVIDQQNPTATTSFALAPFYRAGVKYGIPDLLGDGEALVGFDVEVDFVYEQWSLYDRVLLQTSGVSFAVGGGEPEPLPPVVQPRDWQDAFSVRAGTTWGFLDRMVEVHAGGFWETTAIPNETYNIELVDGDKLGLGVGLSGKLAGVRLDLGYSHVFVLDRVIGDESIITNQTTGPSPFTAETRTRVAMGRYTAGYDIVSLAVNVAFDDMLGFGVHAPRPSMDGYLEAASPAEPSPAPAPAEEAPAPQPAADGPAADGPTADGPDAAPSPEA